MAGTLDVMKLITCTKCGIPQPPASFYIYENSSSAGWCKSCRSADSKVKYAADPDKVLDRNMLRRYGVSREQYEALYAAQDGLCAICKQPESALKYGKVQRLSVDHDHSCCPSERSCGQCVRALLCRNCNVTIAMAHDDPERLEAAASYLRSSTLPILAGSMLEC